MVRQAEALITMTERAQTRMLGLLRERGREQSEVRVFVAGAGCSGYQCGMSIAEGRTEGDIVICQGDLTLLVDPETAPMVRGAEIDYVEDVMQSGFAINNPNAPASACSCSANGGEGPPTCC
ncbi:MAG TPA: iron-sulfur cluster assembly accessory protein [Dehalococcoidia bacterium]|nr:iron-sulfur cluster assembly accessory protein [Dehalococcoidia bacterium]